jgi:hypothetical protein
VDDEAPETTESAPSIEEAAKETEVTPDMYVCFGTIDPDSSECQKCKFNAECAVRAAGK